MPTQINELKDFLERDAFGLADTVFHCTECGRDHTVPIQKMRVGEKLIEEIPQTIQISLGRLPRAVGLVYDRAIEEYIQENAILPLRPLLPKIIPVGIGARGILLDSEVSLGNRTALEIPGEIEYLIGAGSGVICDLTKWIATRLRVPYIVFATAPSMNAYTSITATMTEDDIKTSRLLDPPFAVFMDTGLQALAPMPMIHAGLGDLAARAVCNADWKLSALMQDSYFCPVPYAMTARNETQYLASCAGIARREPQALASLSEAILLSGLSMTVLNGETSPSSGAEHVISHFWDLLTHIRHLPKNLHGTQVGVGTIIMLAFYEVIRTIKPETIDASQVVRSRLSLESIEADNRKRYGVNAETINTVARKKYLSPEQHILKIQTIQRRWEMIWQAIDPYLARLESIRTPLKSAGMELTLASVNRTRDEALEALVKGPQYRARYTILDLASELGLMPGLGEEALAHSGVLG